jgi:hypothetical protein
VPFFLSRLSFTFLILLDFRPGINSEGYLASTDVKSRIRWYVVQSISDKGKSKMLITAIQKIIICQNKQVVAAGGGRSVIMMKLLVHHAQTSNDAKKTFVIMIDV